MKKVLIVTLLFIATFIPGGLINPSSAQSVDASRTVKTTKKTKKNKKKSKKSSLKVSKTAAGEQDEVSDQTDVSQQADRSATKKKKR